MRMKKQWGKKAAVFLVALTMVLSGFSAMAAEEEFDVSGSKKAAPTELACENRETTVTLQLPAGEYQNEIDIVFTMDSSSSAQNSTMFTESVNELFASILENNPNVKLKVGVIRFRGRAHDAIAYLSDNAYKELVEYNDETKDYINQALNMSEADIKAAFGNGSNTHGGMDIADEWLAADTEVSDDHKYVVLLTDGKTYIWNNDENEPTCIYSQFYTGKGDTSQTIDSNGKPTLNQKHGYMKYVAGSAIVDVLDQTNRSNVFVFSTYQALYDSDSEELTGESDWDVPCLYADDRSAVPSGTAVKHEVTNGAELFGSNTATYGSRKDYQYYFEFQPNDAWVGVPYLQANPFQVIENADGTYTFDTENVNPLYYGYHADGLQKGMYKAGHLWTEMGKKYNCAVITYAGGSNDAALSTIRPSFISWLQENSKFAADIATSAQVQDMFTGIDNSIRYMVSKGTVTDVIADDFTLQNTDKADCFKMTLNGEALTGALADGKWTFGTADEAGVFPYEVAYDDAAKTIVWTINVPIENTNPVTLSYDLLLDEEATTGFYETNKSAVLDYTSTDGKKDGTFTFEVPKVSYIACVEINVQKVWEDNNDEAGARPETVSVVLKDEDGGEWTLDLTERSQWTDTFTHDPENNKPLPDSKLVNGEFVPVNYSLQEVTVENYDSAVSGSAKEGFVITNTYEVTPPPTGDMNILPFAGMFLLAAAAVCVLLRVGKAKEQ